ncbi:hypothetical protein IMZ48_08090 [Candidatus Bathyarchaeota archaeon]|nr:hypothetical protein [Candidatus Bathyarchaeota archaeon]
MSPADGWRQTRSVIGTEGICQLTKRLLASADPFAWGGFSGERQLSACGHRRWSIATLHHLQWPKPARGEWCRGASTGEHLKRRALRGDGGKQR